MLDTVLHVLLIAGGALVGGWFALLLALGLAVLLARLRGAARRWAVAGLVVAAAATGWAVAGHLRQRHAAPPPGPAQVGDSMRAAMR